MKGPFSLDSLAEPPGLLSVRGPITVAVSSTDDLHTSTNRCIFNNELLSEEDQSQWPYLPLTTCTQTLIPVHLTTNFFE